MEQKSSNQYFPAVGDGSGIAQTEALYKEQLQLALRNRADAAGSVQPIDQQWNFGGYGNNGAQRVKVMVR